MNMGNADPSPEIEIERLRQALEAETCLRLETQRQLARANTEVRAANVRLSKSLYELRWRQADSSSSKP